MKKMIGLLLLATFPLLAGPQLKIEPNEVDFHQRVLITLKGLNPKSHVKIMARMEDEKGRHWKSEAVFMADAKGRVDLSKQAPKEGSYDSIDPMGLFWSMQPTLETKDNSAFRHTGNEPLYVSIAAEHEGGKVLLGKVKRHVIRKEVNKIPVNVEGVVGNLFLPGGKGPHPTVIVLGGANGGIPPDAYVAQFANRGYAALGIAYYRAPGVSDLLANIPLEYMEQAIAWMKKQKNLKHDRLIVVGTSMGGSYALLSASMFPEIRGAIVFDGAGVVFQALDPATTAPEPQSTFSYRNKPIPFIPINVPQLTPVTLNTSLFLRLFLSSFFEQPKDVIELASIKVEKIHGPVLLMGSLDDRLFASAFLLHHSYKRLTEHKFPYPYEFVSYKGSGHLLGLAGFPHSPTTRTILEIRQNNMLYDVGGSPKDTAYAQEDSWQKAFAFLERHARVD
jgi:dienelactone hydrolase